jgi:hypothetical protein
VNWDALLLPLGGLVGATVVYFLFQILYTVKNRHSLLRIERQNAELLLHARSLRVDLKRWRAHP